MADRVAECQADMRAIHQACDEIERAMQNTHILTGPDIWSGPAGEKFRGEWGDHRSAIRPALDSIRGQTDDILAKVKREKDKA